jgi:uncharacterized repeat protein (TIGR01451 family)
MGRRLDRRDRRRATFLLVAVALVLALPTGGLAMADPPGDVPGPPSGDGIAPVIVDTPASSDDCGELGFAHGLSIAGNGQVSGDGRTVTVSGYNAPTGFVDWSSTLPIHGVYVKGGPSGGNLFAYPAGDTGDTDLHTPLKIRGDFYDVSHVAICWNDVTPAANVTVTKSNDPPGVVANEDTITYTLTVSNEGDATATGVTLTDPLPAGTTFVEATLGCVEANGTVSCDLGEIDPDVSLDVDITVAVDEVACGPLDNVATVAASNESGPALDDNASNEVTNTVECAEPRRPDLQVTKSSAADGPLHEGDSFLYTITVTNVGEQGATGVELVDVLPAGAVHVALSPFPTLAGETCTVTSSLPPNGVEHTEVRCGPVALGPGASASVTVRVIVSGDVCGTITNVVDVAATNEPDGAVGADNHAEASDEVACVARIRLQKGGPSLIHLGDTIPYVFVVANGGHVALSDVALLDPGCDGSPALVDHGNGDALLAPAEEWTFACGHTVTRADGNAVHNEATVSADHEGGSVSDTDIHDVEVIHPAIDLEKTSSPTSGTPGTTITYTYAVENTGDTALHQVSVDDDVLGHVGDIPILGVGQTVQLQASMTLGDAPVINVGRAEGADVLGLFVSDSDDASVSVVAGQGGGGSPFTGSEAGSLLPWILVLTGVGSVAVSVSRRRHQGTR